PRAAGRVPVPRHARAAASERHPHVGERGDGGTRGRRASLAVGEQLWRRPGVGGRVVEQLGRVAVEVVGGAALVVAAVLTAGRVGVVDLDDEGDALEPRRVRRQDARERKRRRRRRGGGGGGGDGRRAAGRGIDLGRGLLLPAAAARGQRQRGNQGQHHNRTT